MYISRSVRLLAFITAVLLLNGLFISPGHALDPESLVARWLFDDVDGNIAPDSSGNGHDGTIIGAAQIVDGKFGEAIEFIGGDSVTVPDHEALNFGVESFSVVFWLSFSNAQDWNRIVRERNPSPWGSGNYGWEVQTQGTQIHFSVDDAAGGHQKTTYADLADGEWHHAAMIIDREEDMLRTYVDGDNEKTINIGNIDSVTDTLPITFGGGFIGAIDEVAIYNTVLDQEDVQDIINQGLEELSSGTAVKPAGKFAGKWSGIRSQY